MTDSEKLDLILSRLDKADNRFDQIDKQFDQIDKQFGQINKQFDQIDKKLEKVDKIEKDTADIKLTLENEIRVNIRRVAEGHLDLSRNLHEAMKIDSEKEMLAIRVNALETELRRIKERLDQTA